MISFQSKENPAGKFRNAVTMSVSMASLGSALPCNAAQTSEQAASIIATKCISCHNEKALSGGFELVTPGGAVAFINPGNADQSRLVRAVEQGKMPPTGKLSAAEMAVIRKWVAEGAIAPKTAAVPNPPALRPLWSFSPLRHPVVPKTKFDKLAINPIAGSAGACMSPSR